MYVRSSRSQHSLLDSARDDVGDQELSGEVIYAEVSCSRNDAIDLSKRKKNRSQSQAILNIPNVPTGIADSAP